MRRTDEDQTPTGGGGSSPLPERKEGPVGKFNPMSQKFVEDMQEFAKNTRNPDIGGATFSPRLNRNIGINFSGTPGPGEEKSDLFIVGGAPQPGPNGTLGPRFETKHVLSADQFTASHAEGGALRAAIAQYQNPETHYASGSWHITDEAHPRRGQVDLDIPDIHPGGPPGSEEESVAHGLAEERGEEEYVRTQGPENPFRKTRHSPTAGGS